MLSRMACLPEKRREQLAPMLPSAIRYDFIYIYRFICEIRGLFLSDMREVILRMRGTYETLSILVLRCP
jgi:hypothetical protein